MTDTKTSTKNEARDNRKRIPIPKDIQPGDVLVLRDGRRKEWQGWSGSGYSICKGGEPGLHHEDGSWCGKPEWDVVAVERKPQPKPKPPRDDKDAAWLMNGLAPWLVDPVPKRVAYRIRAIALRLNGGKAVGLIALAALALAGCATDPQPVPGAPEVIRPPDWPATVTTMPDGKRVVTVSCDMVPRVIVLLQPAAAEGKGVGP